MILTTLLLGLLGAYLALACIRRVFRALEIDPLEMLLFFGLAETIEPSLPRPASSTGRRRGEVRLPRARYEADDRRSAGTVRRGRARG